MLRYTTLALGLTLSACVSVPVYAQGQNTCQSRAMMIGILQGQYEESRRSIALAGNDGIVEMYASDETGTWTIAVTRPDGITCILAAGTHYIDVSDENTPEGEDT